MLSFNVILSCPIIMAFNSDKFVFVLFSSSWILLFVKFWIWSICWNGVPPKFTYTAESFLTEVSFLLFFHPLIFYKFQIYLLFFSIHRFIVDCLCYFNQLIIVNFHFFFFVSQDLQNIFPETLLNFLLQFLFCRLESLLKKYSTKAFQNFI
jgi:hypothetical protein